MMIMTDKHGCAVGITCLYSLLWKLKSPHGSPLIGICKEEKPQVRHYVPKTTRCEPSIRQLDERKLTQSHTCPPLHIQVLALQTTPVCDSISHSNGTVAYRSALSPRNRDMEESASPAGVKQKLARTDERRCISLLDLPENLIIDILRYLPTKSKCQAELVCRAFREILSNPNPADYVWDVLDVNTSVLQHIPLPALHK